MLETKFGSAGCSSGSEAENAQPCHGSSPRIREKVSFCCINFLLMFLSQKFNGSFFKVMKLCETLGYFLLL